MQHEIHFTISSWWTLVDKLTYHSSLDLNLIFRSFVPGTTTSSVVGDVDCTWPPSTVPRDSMNTGLTFQTLRFSGGGWQLGTGGNAASSLLEMAHYCPSEWHEITAPENSGKDKNKREYSHSIKSENLKFKIFF